MPAVALDEMPKINRKADNVSAIRDNAFHKIYKCPENNANNFFGKLLSAERFKFVIYAKNGELCKIEKVRFDAIIIGAGAAGLFCAAEAGKRRRKVLVLEKKCADRAKNSDFRRRTL